jgi:hypothetical protein
MMKLNTKLTNIRTVLVCLSGAIALGACGGGAAGNSAGSTKAAANTPTSVNVSQQNATDASWIECAAEGGTCTLTDTRTVRYGVNGSYFYKVVTGPIACNNEVWGDPLFGTWKSCDYSSSTSPELPAAVWAYLATERESFAVNGMQTVRYGLNDNWVVKTVTGSGVCSNEYFGADPIFGIDKRCEVDSASAQPLVVAGAVPVPVQPSPPLPAPTSGSPLTSARVLISGHSLTDNPLADFMAQIAQSMGTSMLWNQQIAGGSTIRYRTRGENSSDNSFPGYANGKNRNGFGLNMVTELANPQTLGGERYDTLLLTERYDLGTVLLSDDTVRYARHYHERLIAGNARANSFLYHPWLEVDKDAPGNWINYEREAAPAWQCVAERINVSLAASNRNDRMTYLPAGLALADLVEQATSSNVPGVSSGSVRQTLDQLFYDNVHLTGRGSYYIALVSYASIYRRSPVGAWAPADINADQARLLQEIAWQSVRKYYDNASTPSMGQCQAKMRETYCQAFANFRGGTGMLENCKAQFTQQSQDNPFYFNAATDADYWFPAPQ